ncbi:DUF4350 domain-containing protein [Spirillospora albida]|uniref:DUF4350 domain-containing protein n=1 Tax=Spirillospora albida TaxID=58123 RepID=UPI00068C5A38|nr:DUF4350 domain-containing protein [Spirillospora albida]
MTPTAPAGAPAAAQGPAGGDAPSAREVAGRRWRSSRAIVAVLLALAVIAVILAALRPSVSPDALDPESPGRDGSRALAEILKRNGADLSVARSTRDALRASTPRTVLVVTRTERLTTDDIDRLRATPGELVLVVPGPDVLEALAPGVEPAGVSFTRTAAPGCGLQAATLAGTVDFGRSDTYTATDPLAACYRTDIGHRLVQVRHHGRTVTVLGSARPFTNEHLEREGDAALAMNLAGAEPSVVWLIPDPPEPGAERQKSLGDLLPFGVKLFVLELLVAVLLVALWRARRLGPVVAEALPVVVRSAETVEGRARLYRASRARDRAADALRAGARERIVPLLGLPRSSAQDFGAAREIVAAVAQRTTFEDAQVGAVLYGPEPADDAALIALTDVLDDLERQVRQS